ncbi:MAG: GntR family transcriptional regulator [Desulfohalobiaceae bacterium]|nr:GntR family transcriptional regulator [Desulfohalobiaceae bacterium]
MSRIIIDTPKSISDQVYEYLKSQIISDQISSSERLTQEKVAEEINTSRTPVREAFRRLEQDGLVERLPQGGIRVTTVDPESISHKFGVREALEAYAIELACDQISESTIAELEEIKRQAYELLEQANLKRSQKIKRLFDLNTTFHETIYEATGNPYLIKEIQQIRQMVLVMRALGLRDDSTWIEVWKEHGELIEFLREKDKEAAVNCLRRHIRNAASYVISMINK